MPLRAAAGRPTILDLVPHHLSKRFAAVHSDFSLAHLGTLLPLGAVLTFRSFVNAYSVPVLMWDHLLEQHRLSLRADYYPILLLEVVLVVLPATAALAAF